MNIKMLRLVRGLAQAAIAELGEPPVLYQTSEGVSKMATLEGVNTKTGEARVRDGDALVTVPYTDVEIILVGEQW